MTARTESRGQAIVEFALVAPILLAIFLGFLDLGRVVWAQDAVSNAAREAARYAIAHGGSATTACPVGPAATTAVIPVASATCPYPAPSKQAVVNTGLDYAATSGGSVNVAVCYGSGCSGDDDAAGATDARGTPVTVRVSTSVSLLTNALLGWAPFNVSGSTTMIVSH
jgi:Flp pilus assembly protein TadG